MSENRCVLTFVMENKSKESVDTLRLNLFVFNQENRVYRRMVTEMGPVLDEKPLLSLLLEKSVNPKATSRMLATIDAAKIGRT